MPMPMPMTALCYPGVMPGADPTLGERPRDAGRFATTHWSVVQAAGATDSRDVRPAMSRLIETYWYPLYAFIRRKGHGPDEACDLTQEFFSRLLERNFLHTADPDKGRFRTFLLRALARFLVDEWRHESRQKRGGGRAPLSLSALEAEERYRLEPADTLTPERIYERRWAMTLLEQAMARLEEECAAAGREALFAAVKPILCGEDAQSPYAVLAARLDMKEGALKTAVHRLRRRFGALLRGEIAATVSDPAEVEEEVQYFLHRLR
jgi:RNA polymerase sigma-70 factor (ECF subfamily)